jgi:hypothetical protein
MGVLSARGVGLWLGEEDGFLRVGMIKPDIFTLLRTGTFLFCIDQDL